MFRLLKDAFKVKDIRSKILFTVFVLFVFRLGAHITVPRRKCCFIAKPFFFAIFQHVELGKW